MQRIIACLTQEHDFRLVLVAALVCLTGAILTVRLFMRARNSLQAAGKLQIALAAIVGGGMIWATHFIAMLAYDPAVDHGYEPFLTGLSLIVGILGVLVALIVATFTSFRYWMEIGGAVFGLTVAAMHYIGMSAYILPGEIFWDRDLITASIILGMGFGALSFNRIRRPITRYCWHAAVLALVLSICSMHFIGMSAINISLNPTIVVPPNPISDGTLALLVLAAIIVVLTMELSAFMIKARLSEETRKSVQKMSVTDTLTGLPNRLALQDQMTLITREQHKHLGPNGIIVIDLDMFKPINDMHGVLFGDAVLKIIANRLLDACQERAFLARSGGDEFVAITTNTRTSNDTKILAQRIRAIVTVPLTHEDLTLQLGVCIGWSPMDEDIGKALEQADVAMSHAKQNGRNQICMFEPQMYEKERARRAIRLGLRDALSNGQFELHYQRQNDIASQGLVGFEALIRWRDPDKGLISPGMFIPIAEESGLIGEIGRWVLHQACHDAASWPQPYRVAVNVAPSQLLQPEFAEDVADILLQTGLSAARLELEITEASIISDNAQTLKMMHQIKALGVRIAMDDFGTGYSSLATLQAFPFDKIKIDRSFVTDVHLDKTRAAIIRATCMIADTMNIPVLAEGVENTEELGFLAAENCKEVQGFYFSKPLSPADMDKLWATTAPQQKLAS